MRLFASLLFCLGIVFISNAIADESTAPALDLGEMPKIDIGRGGHCVRDPKWMLRNHMYLLKHQRDLTVHEGIRDDKVNLQNCVECHASLRDNSVIARDDSFCVACHRFEAVKLDCFECHSGTRKSAWLEMQRFAK